MLARGHSVRTGLIGRRWTSGRVKATLVRPPSSAPQAASTPPAGEPGGATGSGSSSSSSIVTAPVQAHRVPSPLPPLPKRDAGLARWGDQASALAHPDMTPRKHEESVKEKSKSMLYNVIAAGIAIVSVALYRLTTSKEATRQQQMLQAAAYLRECRATGAKALAGAVHERGVIQLSPRTHIEYVSAGPHNADVYILMPADDGETVDMWGNVFSVLCRTIFEGGGSAGRTVRIIAYQRVGRTPSPFETADMSLRLRDMDAVLLHTTDGKWAPVVAPAEALGTHSLLESHIPERVLTVRQPFGSPGMLREVEEAEARAKPWWQRWLWWLPSQPDPVRVIVGAVDAPPPAAAARVTRGGASPRVVLLGHKDSVWSSLQYAASTPNTSLAVVAVAPTLLCRGAHTAWVDALPRVSRAMPPNPVAALEEALAAPPLREDGAGSDVASQLSQQDSDFRTNLMKVSAVINPSAQAKEEEKRLAEEVRRRRSRSTVMSALEIQDLLSTAPALCQNELVFDEANGRYTATHPAVSVVTYAPNALPSFLPDDQLLPTELWWLQAAHAVGVSMLHPSARSALTDMRDVAADDMALELSHGMFKMTRRRRAATDPNASDSNEGAASVAAHARADGVADSVLRAPTAAASRAGDAATRMRMPASVRDRLDALASAAVFQVAAAPALDASMHAGDDLVVTHAVHMLPYSLGWKQYPPVSKTFSFLHMQQELRYLPPNFGVSLVNAPSHVEPTVPLRDDAPRAVLATVSGVTHLPLQAPHPIVDEVLHALQGRSLELSTMRRYRNVSNGELL